MAGGDKYPSSYTNSLIRKVCLSMVLDRYLFWITHPTRYSWVHNPKERQCLIIFLPRSIFFFISKQKTHRHITSTIIAFFLNTYSQNKQSRNQKKRDRKREEKNYFFDGIFYVIIIIFSQEQCSSVQYSSNIS